MILGAKGAVESVKKPWLVNTEILALLQEVIDQIIADFKVSLFDILRPFLLPVPLCPVQVCSASQATTGRLKTSPPYILHKAFPVYSEATGRPPGSSVSLRAQSTFGSKIPVKPCLPEAPPENPKAIAGNGLHC